MFCKTCGAELPRKPLAFCPKCGAPVQPDVDVEPPRISAQQPNRVALQGSTQQPQAYAGANVTNVVANAGIASSYAASGVNGITLTVMEGSTKLAERTFSLGTPGSYTVGTDQRCSVVVRPRRQGAQGFCLLVEISNDQCVLSEQGTATGLYLNGIAQQRLAVTTGDVLCVGSDRSSCIVVAVGDADTRWEPYSLAEKTQVRLGRSGDNEIRLSDASISDRHAQLLLMNDNSWWIEDLGSHTGTFVDAQRVTQPMAVPNGSRVMLGGATFFLSGDSLVHLTRRMGMDVQAQGLVRYRGRGRNRRITTDHVSLHIRKGEFVAIVGGSGSGKSTLLNELNGWEPADEGSVFVDGIDLYANYDVMRNSIGYVPQQDIVHDNLALDDMLEYSARLRMPSDTTKEEREARVDEVLQLLEIDEFRKTLVGKLSGGQKKRASIAVELLADPRLLFLDEPTSGLDPGIEEHMMMLLRSMANDGRTIVLVTHVTSNLSLCDRTVILGPGGKLCYFDVPDTAAAYFGEKAFVKVYDKINQDPKMWQAKCQDELARLGTDPLMPPTQTKPQEGHKPPVEVQFKTLAARYAKLIFNDRSRLALLLLQAPILAALIAFVAGKDCFEIYENTKSCLFALSCAAFWVGILDSIQEICKERDIFRREYDGGMRLTSYLASKVVILGALCVVQAATMTLAFCAMIPKALEVGVLSGPLELFVSLLLLTLSAMCLGLLVSALFGNADRAIALAPLLIMPQILFSGVVVELSGVVAAISTIVNCRWGMSALGSVADLNSLTLRVEDTLDLPGINTDDLRPEIDAVMFNPVFFNIASAWSVLLVFCLICIAACLGFLWLGTRRR